MLDGTYTVWNDIYIYTLCDMCTCIHVDWKTERSQSYIEQNEKCVWPGRGGINDQCELT